MPPPKDFLDPMTQDEPERVKEIRQRQYDRRKLAEDRGADVGNNHLYGDIDALLSIISLSEKRAEEVEEDLPRVTTERDDARASFAFAESERDSSQASLLRVEAWREMKDAPEIEGAEIIACNRKHGHRPCKFVWKGNPHVIGGIEFPVEKGWYAKGEPIMIRRSYQDDYVWVPLPRTALSPHKET